MSLYYTQFDGCHKKLYLFWEVNNKKLMDDEENVKEALMSLLKSDVLLLNSIHLQIPAKHVMWSVRVQ